MTGAGPISPAGFGSALAHEHVLVDFIGADKVSRERTTPPRRSTWPSPI